MTHQNLRTFLAELESSGRLKHVTAEVDKDWEIACIARWATEGVPETEAYALQFDHVKGFDIPVVVGLFSSRELYARALKLAPEQLLSHWAAALENPRPLQVVDDAPVQEIAITGDQVNLARLPIPVWTPGRDAGPYIPSGGVITRDPETGIQNLGVYRLQVHNSKTLGLFFGSPSQHGAIHLKKYRRTTGRQLCSSRQNGLRSGRARDRRWIGLPGGGGCAGQNR